MKPPVKMLGTQYESQARLPSLFFSAIAAIILFPFSIAFAKEQTMVVNDPTGTPLNVRGVRGEIKCKVTNGEVVYRQVADGAFAEMGKDWTPIRTQTGCIGRAWSKYLSPLR